MRVLGVGQGKLKSRGGFRDRKITSTGISYILMEIMEIMETVLAIWNSGKQRLGTSWDPVDTAHVQSANPEKLYLLLAGSPYVGQAHSR